MTIKNKLILSQAISIIAIALITVGTCFINITKPIEEQGIITISVSVAAVIFAVAFIATSDRLFLIMLPCMIVATIIAVVASINYRGLLGYDPLFVAIGIPIYAFVAASIAILLTIDIVLSVLPSPIPIREINKKKVASLILTTVINFSIFYWVPGLIQCLLA